MNPLSAPGGSRGRPHGPAKTIARVTAMMVLVACSDSGPGSPRSITKTPAEIMATPQPRDLSPEERQIIDELVSLFPKSESKIRALLSDKRVATIELPGQRATALLTRLTQLRSGGGATFGQTASASGDNLSAAAREAPPATVVLVPQLADPTADVIVVRRTNPSVDMIVLAEGQANGARLGAGIAALFKLRKELGDASPRDVSLVVHGAKMPKKWPPELRAEAERVVTQLRAKGKQHVRGLGEARSIEIHMAGTPR